MPVSRNRRNDVPRTHLEAMVYFISQMDTEMVASLLDDDKTYEDVSKLEFLQLLDKTFDEFKSAGDTRLKTFRGECLHCYPTWPGMSFIGEHSRHYMNLVFELEGEQVTDICECSRFENYMNDEQLGNRIWLKEDEGFDIF
jgi:hypothetical protein